MVLTLNFLSGAPERDNLIRNIGEKLRAAFCRTRRPCNGDFKIRWHLFLAGLILNYTPLRRWDAVAAVRCYRRISYSIDTRYLSRAVIWLCENLWALSIDWEARSALPQAPPPTVNRTIAVSRGSKSRIIFCVPITIPTIWFPNSKC